MNAKEIKAAWDNKSPVIFCKPGQDPIECHKIEEIHYKRHPRTDKKMVSCVVIPVHGAQMPITARGRDLRFKYRKSDMEV